jgi:transcriptional regulator with XRE-family HTH domain
MKNGWPTAETLGGLIARTRSDQGISQLRLAERLCASAGLSTVTRNEVSRWERGERIPTGYWMGWLAVALGVPLEQLERAAAVSRQERHRTIPPNWTQLAAGVYVRRAS